MARFRIRSLELFFRVLALALVVKVADDFLAGGIEVHRHQLWSTGLGLALLPLSPVPVLLVEWAVLCVSAVLLLGGWHRPTAVRAAFCAMLANTLEDFHNHKALFCLVLFYLSLSVPDQPIESCDLLASNFPNLALVRWQLLIVYAFGAVNKLAFGFLWNGSLSHTLTSVLLMHGQPIASDAVIHWIANPVVSEVLSVLVVLAEFALPVLLRVRPRMGFLGVVLLHTAFAVLMPGIWPFTLLMIAMATLFLPDPVTPGFARALSRAPGR